MQNLEKKLITLPHQQRKKLILTINHEKPHDDQINPDGCGTKTIEKQHQKL